MAENPAESENNLLGLEEISPLRVLSMETHEIYQELEAAGFSERVLVQIIAHMLYDAMQYRAGADDEDDSDDPFDEGDVIDGRSD